MNALQDSGYLPDPREPITRLDRHVWRTRQQHHVKRESGSCVAGVEGPRQPEAEC